MTAERNPGGAAGTLFVVSTPIGNLEDITLRAIRVLREADVILAEDTRRTRVLCDAHGVGTRIQSFHAHSGASAAEAWAEKVATGARVALVTDAGTPLVSDPGFALVERARAKGARVEAIPGPSAVLAALASAGVPCDTFTFLGFLPRKGEDRRRAFASIRSSEHASVFYESPRRLRGTLADLVDQVGAERTGAVCRELTKLHEEVRTGTLAALLEGTPDEVLGEVTVIVAGERDLSAKTHAREESARAVASWCAAHEVGARDAAELIQLVTGLGRSQAYDSALAAQREGPGDPSTDPREED